MEISRPQTNLKEQPVDAGILLPSCKSNNVFINLIYSWHGEITKHVSFLRIFKAGFKRTLQ